MSSSHVASDARRTGVSLGPALRRAWVGYHRRLDQRMSEAGFGQRGFPDGRVLRMCRDTETTISDIGRELGITRQGASKIVANLRERRYVRLRSSQKDGRERIVQLTPRALDYLATQRTAVRAIDRELRTQLGDEVMAAAHQLLDALGAHEETRMRDYLRTMGIREV